MFFINPVHSFLLKLIERNKVDKITVYTKLSIFSIFLYIIKQNNNKFTIDLGKNYSNYIHKLYLLYNNYFYAILAFLVLMILCFIWILFSKGILFWKKRITIKFELYNQKNILNYSDKKNVIPRKKIISNLIYKIPNKFLNFKMKNFMKNYSDLIVLIFIKIWPLIFILTMITHTIESVKELNHKALIIILFLNVMYISYNFIFKSKENFIFYDMGSFLDFYQYILVSNNYSQKQSEYRIVKNKNTRFQLLLCVSTNPGDCRYFVVILSFGDWSLNSAKIIHYFEHYDEAKQFYDDYIKTIENILTK